MILFSGQHRLQVEPVMAKKVGDTDNYQFKVTYYCNERKVKNSYSTDVHGVIDQVKDLIPLLLEEEVMNQ